MVSVESLATHADLLGLLGRLHRQPPDDEGLARLRGLPDEWPLPESETATQGLNRWRNSRTATETAQSIERDHDRLYGVSAVAVVPPYESVHREVEGLVFGEATLEVRRAYRESGLQVPEPNRVPDDHLGLEFDFLSQVLLRAAECADQGDDAGCESALQTARRFLSGHVLVWAPAMLNRAAEAARTEFMAGLAVLSLALLESGRTLLGVDGGGAFETRPGSFLT